MKKQISQSNIKEETKKKIQFLDSIENSDIEAKGLKVLSNGRDLDENSPYIQICDPDSLFDDNEYTCHYEILYMGDADYEHGNHEKNNIYVEIHFESEKYSSYFASTVAELSKNQELETFFWRDYCPGLRLRNSVIIDENENKILNTLEHLKKITLEELIKTYKNTICINKKFKPGFTFDEERRGVSPIRSLYEFYREPKEIFIIHEAIKKKLINAIKTTPDMFDKKDPIQKLSPENLVNNANFIDLVAKTKKGKFIFFEIKTAYDARLCIRQALGQLMEYAFYSGNDYAQKLVIVGPGQKTPEIGNYLKILNKKIDVEIDYKMLSAE